MHPKAASFTQIMALILVIFLSTGWILYQGAENLEQRSIKNRALALAAQHSIDRAATVAAEKVEKRISPLIRENRTEIQKAQEVSVQARLDAIEAKRAARAAKEKAGVSLDKASRVNSRIRRYEDRIYPYRRFE